MKGIITKIALLALLTSIVSCQKETKTKPKKNKKPIESIKKEEKIVEHDTLGFPKKGNTFSDFVIDTNYEIDQEIHGLLNNDLLEDTVLILKDKDDKTGNRVLLVILKQKDASLKLFSKNETIMGAEFTSDGYKIHNDESISINDHKLMINLYCVGPCGNTDIEFSLKKNSLLLTNYETLNMGAGSHLETNFDGEKATVTVTNTMEEEMPTETESFDLNYKYSLNFSDFEVSKLDQAITSKTKLEW